ncbi:MAG: hypothetical protein WDA60_07105 [Acidimicrobiia bacterium]|jgi:hypothetical protein
MTNVLTDRVAIQLDARANEAVAGPTRPNPARPRSPARRRLVVAAAFAGLLAAFGAHLAAYGAWIVDDAGISFAYAANLAHGHGLVAQPGATPVEGFSNPLWVGIFTGLTKLHLFGSVGILGMPGYVVVTKGLALLLHAVVLACLAVVIRRALEAVRGGPPSFGIFVACWIGAGLLLAANPSYVIWMGSGLENPLLAAIVAALAAVAMGALPKPSTGRMVALGGLAGLAALTRPDGIVYASVVVVVALLATASGPWRRVALAGWGGAPFVGILGAYVAFRVAYFGMWIPNTAVAKSQQLPSLADLGRVEFVADAFGVPLVFIALVGGGIAVWTLRRAGDGLALRVLGAGATVLGAAVVAYLVLPNDWMRELRFLTPVWPLLSAAAALGAAQLVSLGGTTARRAMMAIALGLAAVMVLPSWSARAETFRDAPTLPLCSVATRYGRYFDGATRALGLDPVTTSVLLPDIGGVLLTSDLEVQDLAGLTEPAVARMIRDGDGVALSRYILDDLRPTFIHVFGDWAWAAGLRDNPQLRADYVDIRAGQDWVRRDALTSANAAVVLPQLAARAAALEHRNPRASCAPLLFD